jgi:hypothetical protein
MGTWPPKKLATSAARRAALSTPPSLGLRRVSRAEEVEEAGSTRPVGGATAPWLGTHVWIGGDSRVAGSGRGTRGARHPGPRHPAARHPAHGTRARFSRAVRRQVPGGGGYLRRQLACLRLSTPPATATSHRGAVTRALSPAAAPSRSR